MREIVEYELRGLKWHVRLLDRQSGHEVHHTGNSRGMALGRARNRLRNLKRRTRKKEEDARQSDS